MTDSEYDQPSARILVPIDLRADVIRPMRDLEIKVDALSDSLHDHIEQHDEDKAEAERRRARVRRIVKWAATAGGGGAASALAYLLQQVAR